MKKDEVFYQSKYDYYQTLARWVIIVGSLASTTYIVSDSQIMGHFSWETFIPRMSVLVFLLIYLFIERHVHNYKILVPAGYFMIHYIMWATIWTIVYLPDKQHANEGFIIMHLMFFAMGLCAPFKHSTIAHSLVAVNIIVSNLFNHYESFWQMIFLALPCIIAICTVNYVMEKSYMEHYQMKLELERLTMEDQLTGIFNRNVLRKICKEDGRTLKAPYNQNTCVFILDIDHFKQVNDTYGHSAGDQALISVTNSIRDHLFPSDVALRWGGEEFVIILPNCTIDEAETRAQDIRHEVSATQDQVCHLTVSIGVTTYDGIDLYHTVALADTALYEAKESGRNRVVVASGSLPQ